MAQGRFLGRPYDGHRPALRLGLEPKACGWGYGINFAALIRRLLGG